MKHIHTFQRFSLNESIELDLTDPNDLDMESKTLTVWYTPDNWDDRNDYERSMEALAMNENDILSEEIDELLGEYGFTIDTSREHDFDLRSGRMTLHLVKMDPIWVKIK